MTSAPWQDVKRSGDAMMNAPPLGPLGRFEVALASLCRETLARCASEGHKGSSSIPFGIEA